MSDTDAAGPDQPDTRLDREAVAPDPAARGVLYQTLARVFEHPTEQLHADLAGGDIETGLRDALAATTLEVTVPALSVEDDYRQLSARYNGLFALGSAVTTDRTDGSVETEGPAVSLYESSHRDDATWETVNVDLARAYEYYGLSVDTDERDHHDNLGLQLEFAGYLARREALGEDDAAAARRDLLDRHLTVFTDSLRESLAEPATAGIYTVLATVLDRVVAADHADLTDRLDTSASTDGREVSW
ncbi:molecular chaperone [Halorhabdus sp. CBA1104]|uniref:molecular chaperone TorD family protein n=1 Tax=Halorhabdus sp. CBA1104 TaxID=1380432 RepID=UPI0012B3ABA6|nr:molecular chaperone TorD family protein [Halorhabdus sp. CBA1104]QGN07961.1 molecular chaperone [Halorhabdus sp. CBA1104]